MGKVTIVVVSGHPGFIRERGDGLMSTARIKADVWDELNAMCPVGDLETEVEYVN
jgi:hypothetical protein